MYNDIEIVQDKEVFDKLIENGIDAGLAQHIAHLFIRDVVILFEEKLHLDDRKDTDHFEVDCTPSPLLAACLFF